jgi:hypothetical protein
VFCVPVSVHNSTDLCSGCLLFCSYYPEMDVKSIKFIKSSGYPIIGQTFESNPGLSK